MSWPFGRSFSSDSGDEDGGLCIPLIPVLGGGDPLFMGGVISIDNVFKTRQIATCFVMSETFGALLLVPPPGNISV